MKNKFSREKLIKIFSEKKVIVDIGGGLRIDRLKNNREQSENFWLKEYLGEVDYKVLDKVADYHPDIVGDIHNLPLADNSVDAIICIAVLEHVENPIKACEEIYRVLKPGGFVYIFVPFLYYYHPMKGYYNDFYRFTIDGVKYLLRDFHDLEYEKLRGPIETLNNLLPGKISRNTVFLARFFDKLIKRPNNNVVSGFNVFGIK